MSFFFIDAERIRACLGHDSIVITANQRIANQTRRALDNDPGLRSVSGQQQTPRKIAPEKVISLDDWLMTSWQLIAPNDVVKPLTSHQELVLWEKIIQQQSSGLLLKPHSTAVLAQSAHRNLGFWQQEIDAAFNHHPDTHQFARWSYAYRQECERHQWVDQVARAQAVLAALHEGLLAPAGTIVPVGFQSLPPLTSAVLSLASEQLRTPEPKARASSIERLGCDNPSAEIAAAAQWSRNLLNTGHRRIGVIIPDLAQRRAEIERAFQAAHEPAPANSFTLKAPTKFNISASPGLGDAPLIHAAIEVLQLNQREIEAYRFYSLLRSPFLLTPQFGAAAALERKLRRTGIPVYEQSLLLEVLQRLEQEPGIETNGPWLNGLQEFFTLATDVGTSSATMSEWIAVFMRQLQALGWPGTRTLDSIEYQQVNRWHQAMGDLNALDPILGSVTLAAALAHLSRHIGGIEFQPESETASIQVLGLLEGSGLEFDALWVAGMNDHNWPNPAHPSPFIPFQIQRAQDMPHATPEREYEISNALFETYTRNAKDIVFSYALTEGDQIFRPSRLIKNLPEYKAAALAPIEQLREPTRYLEIYRQHPVEELADNVGPAITPENEPVAGGAQLIKDQASCPFKGFARHRLRARELDEPAFHLTTMERGIILHRALELIWQELLDSAALAQIEPTTLKANLEQAASSALRPHALRRPDLLGPQYLELEQQRLVKLLSRWLLVEQSRAPFNIVATEKSIVLEIAGLPLKLRIDRIDRLEDGRLAIIDYKTGAANMGQWQGDRPDEPQLPLYLLGADLGADISTLAFARVSVDGMGWIGISDQDMSDQDKIAPGITSPAKTRYWSLPTDWDELREHWEQTLASLVFEFQQGHAEVSPKNATSCRFCKLQTLCRIKERTDALEVSA